MPIAFLQRLQNFFLNNIILYICFIINNYNKHFTNNLLIFNFYNTNILKTQQRIKKDYPYIIAMTYNIFTYAAAGINIKQFFSIVRQ